MPFRRSLALLLVATALGGAGLLADPEPPSAQATSLPCVGLSPAGAVGDAIGIGNPVGDACEAVTDPILGAAGDKVLGSLKDAAGSLGKGVFNQVTAWVADGAVWLIGEIAEGINETTSPNLLSKGFLHQYRLMAQIAALMAALMLIFVVLEALARGDLSMLWRAFLVNAPLAAIATSVAYVVVQLLLATSDGMGEAVAQTTGADAQHFFKGTVEALAALGASGGGAAEATGGGTPATAAGAVAVPLFVGFIAAVVMAFAAFFVWIELLMRDAAVYVVALFMPLALAAAIWPRWASALRRTCELLVVVIFSKFVIVAIISLAASMVARGDGSVEQVLAAAAMLLIACFAPFVLFKLVPFAEGAISAYQRQGAGGGTVRAIQTASSMQMMRRAAMANWAGGAGGGAAGGGAGGGSGKPSLGRGGRMPDDTGGKASGTGSAGVAAGAAKAGGGASGLPSAGASAAKAAKGGAGKLAAGSVNGAAAGSSSPSDSARPAAGSKSVGGEGGSAGQLRLPVGTAAPSAEASGSSSPSTNTSGSAQRPKIDAEPRPPEGGNAPNAGGAPARPSSGDEVADSTQTGGNQ
ncbi:MAG TPA: hypothetical protein VFJ61_06575 [Solirubrobacterales bacterium]|nr:hypothetical protein [Solirubrobacterales bacterium]